MDNGWQAMFLRFIRVTLPTPADLRNSFLPRGLDCFSAPVKVDAIMVAGVRCWGYVSMRGRLQGRWLQKFDITAHKAGELLPYRFTRKRTAAVDIWYKEA
jgi:hypothetical protein